MPPVERAKSSARGYATNQSVQLITEDAKESIKNTLIVMLAAVQVRAMKVVPAKELKNFIAYYRGRLLVFLVQLE